MKKEDKKEKKEKDKEKKKDKDKDKKDKKEEDKDVTPRRPSVAPPVTATHHKGSITSKTPSLIPTPANPVNSTAPTQAKSIKVNPAIPATMANSTATATASTAATATAATTATATAATTATANSSNPTNPASPAKPTNQPNPSNSTTATNPVNLASPVKPTNQTNPPKGAPATSTGTIPALAPAATPATAPAVTTVTPSKELSTSQIALDKLCGILFTANASTSDDQLLIEFEKHWTGFNETDINSRNSRGQTLLYSACRSGRFCIVDKLIRLPDIELNGPQEKKNGSTALHGANWGGFFQIMAVLLTCGAVPERNASQDKKEGLLPEEEGNKQLGNATLHKIKDFWKKYKEKGVDGIAEYLPAGWVKPEESVTFFIQESEKAIAVDGLIAAGDVQAIAPTVPKCDEGETPEENNGQSEDSNSQVESRLSILLPSPETPKPDEEVQKTDPLSVRFINLNIEAASDTKSATSPSDRSPSPSPSPDPPSAAKPSAPETLPCYPKPIPSVYRDFRYLFACEDRLYDVKSMSLINKAFAANRPSLTINTKTKKISIDLVKMQQIDLSNKNKITDIHRWKRFPQWFYRDSDGTIKPYEHKINSLICRTWASGAKKRVLRTVLRKQDHELDLDRKMEINLQTDEGHVMFEESDLLPKLNWVPTVEVDSLSHGEVKVDQIIVGDAEYRKVAELFYMSMPSKATIYSIEKILNNNLRRNWSHELENVRKSNDGTNIVFTRMLFHGTGGTPPKLIYEGDKGFLINFASDGLWGRGVYFAQDAFYSHKYAYKIPNSTRILMVLCEVITGDGINLDEDRSLRLPPFKDEASGGKRFDCVIGIRHDTFIYVCYDNGRAYPTYVIEYEDPQIK